MDGRLAAVCACVAVLAAARAPEARRRWVDVQVIERLRDRTMPGLAAADFEVLVNGRPAEITSFGAGQMPLDLAIIEPQTSLTRLEGIRHVIDDLEAAWTELSSADRVAIIRAAPKGELVFALSSKRTSEQAAAAALAADSTVNILRLRSDVDPNGLRTSFHMGLPFPQGATGLDWQSVMPIVDATGGELVLQYERPGRLAEFIRRLRARYLIGIAADDGSGAGELTVRIKGPRGMQAEVRARSGL